MSEREDAPKTCRAAIGLGTNLGDREGHLAAARGALVSSGALRELRASSIVESAPLGPPQPHYLNQVVVGETSLAPTALLAVCQGIERERGRVAGGPRWGPRPLDLDILAMEDLSLTAPELILPHPESSRRRFVLAPWAELEPEFVLPDGDGRTVQERLEALGAPTDEDRLTPWREGSS